MTEPQWIATTSVIFVKPDGTRVPGSIRISLPSPAFESDAQCSYSIEPIAKRRPPVCGADNLQALLLALHLCGTELAVFEKEGGRIEFPPDADGTPGEPWDPKVSFLSFFRFPNASEPKDAEPSSKPSPG